MHDKAKYRLFAFIWLPKMVSTRLNIELCNYFAISYNLHFSLSFLFAQNFLLFQGFQGVHFE